MRAAKARWLRTDCLIRRKAVVLRSRDVFCPYRAQSAGPVSVG